MKTVLFTFSGKFGDILWSLATVQEYKRRNADANISFMIMPQYESLLPLLSLQPYIDLALANPGWICTGSPHGDQPWEPQNSHQLQNVYDEIYHLTYKGHPGIDASEMSLIDFIYGQYRSFTDAFSQWPIPFIYAEKSHAFKYFAYGFNNDFKEHTEQFMIALKQRNPNTTFVSVEELPWIQSATIITNAVGFIGCRSALWVLANGLGIKNCTYEVNASRHKESRFGKVFGNPYLEETSIPLNTSPDAAAEYVTNFFIKDNQ